MKKVIFVIVSMAGGGAERVISVLANGLVLRGADVSILMIADDTVSYPLDPRIHLSAVSVGRTGGSLRKRLMRIRRMRRYFAEHPDSTIIAFGPDVSIFTALSELGQGHRLIFSERNDPAAFPHAFARNLAYGRADVMVFQTLQARDYFGAKLRTRGKVIANPVRRDLPDSLYISQGAERCRTGRIAAVGRLEPQKNHMLLLDAFRRFLCANPSAHRRQVYRLHLYGSGSLLAALESRAKALGIRENVVFEGFCPDVAEVLRNADMYVLSSDYEGISNSLLEAMAVGLPVISTDCPIGGSAQCIQDGQNGLLIRTGDAEALSAAMTRIADSPELALSMARAAYSVRQKYSEERITGEWEALI